MLLVQVQQFGTGTSISLKFYANVTRGLKLKVLRANSHVCRSYTGKTGNGRDRKDFVPPHPQ